MVGQPFDVALQVPLLQVAVVQASLGQDRQATPPVPQAPVAVPGWQTPRLSQQPVQPVAALHWHCPDSSQLVPAEQVPHRPALPQPSGPHCLPVQLGAQHNPEIWLH
jgi:hypothetical protein